MTDNLPNSAGAQATRLADEIKRTQTLLAAINYAIEEAEDGIDWLRAWSYGEPEAMAELNAFIASN